MGGWKELENDDEVRARFTRRTMMLIIIVSVITVVGIGWQTYESFKPLPNIVECEEKGYEGGIVDGNKVYCFNDCIDNILTHCKTIRPIR